MRVLMTCETCGATKIVEEQNSEGLSLYSPPNCPNGHSLFPSDLSLRGPSKAPGGILQAENWEDICGEYYNFYVLDEKGKRFCHYSFYQKQFIPSGISSLYFYLGNATGCPVVASEALTFEEAREFAFDHLVGALNRALTELFPSLIVL